MNASAGAREQAKQQNKRLNRDRGGGKEGKLSGRKKQDAKEADEIGRKMGRVRENAPSDSIGSTRRVRVLIARRLGESRIGIGSSDPLSALIIEDDKNEPDERQAPVLEGQILKSSSEEQRSGEQ